MMRILQIGKTEMVLIRLVDGARRHFIIRLSEWLMLFPIAGMWFALTVQPDMFTLSPSFDFIAGRTSEKMLGTILLIVVVCRASALFINGTFDEFRYSPHMRMFASLIGAIFWAQLSLGFLFSFVYNGGAASDVVMYTTPVVFELANFYRSSRDVGITYAETRDGGKRHA